MPSANKISFIDSPFPTKVEYDAYLRGELELPMKALTCDDQPQPTKSVVSNAASPKAEPTSVSSEKPWPKLSHWKAIDDDGYDDDAPMTVAAFYEAATHGIPFRACEDQSLQQWLTAVRGALARRGQEPVSPSQFLDLMRMAALADGQPSRTEPPANAVPADAALAAVVEFLDEQIRALAALEADGAYDDPWAHMGVNSSYDGGRWYNFGTKGYVECACRGAFGDGEDEDEVEDEDEDEDDEDEGLNGLMPARLSAGELTRFFNCGRVYE